MITSWKEWKELNEMNMVEAMSDPKIQDAVRMYLIRAIESVVIVAIRHGRSITPESSDEEIGQAIIHKIKNMRMGPVVSSSGQKLMVPEFMQLIQRAGASPQNIANMANQVRSGLTNEKWIKSQGWEPRFNQPPPQPPQLGFNRDASFE